MGMIKSAIKDAIFTSMCVFSMPFLGILTSNLAAYVGIEPKSIPGLFISINLGTLFVLTFSIIGAALGGASFNPTTTVSLFAAGLKPDASLLSMAVRFPAQAAGGVGGAKAIMQVIPREYKTLLKGPSLKVDLHTGAVAEGVLSFLFCLALLTVMSKGPKNLLLQIWLVAFVKVGLVSAGRNYTGPSMNPANAHGWAYVNNWHNSWELFYVYWICPLIGAILAAWVFRFLFKGTIKHKQA